MPEFVVQLKTETIEFRLEVVEAASLEEAEEKAGELFSIDENCSMSQTIGGGRQYVTVESVTENE